MYLYGAGGHSKVITNILNSLEIDIVGVFDDRPVGAKLKTMAIYSGIRVQGETFPKLDAPLIISVGDNQRRAGLDLMLRKNVEYGRAIHGTAN